MQDKRNLKVLTFRPFHVCYRLEEPKSACINPSSAGCQEWGQDDRLVECAICVADNSAVPESSRLNIKIQPKAKDEIIITITDDGIGRERSKALKTDHQKKQNSKGMNNIKKRVAILNKMYKDKVDVAIEDFQDSEDAGTKVVVTLKKD